MPPRIHIVDTLESSGLFDEGNANVGPAFFGLPVLLLDITTFLPPAGIGVTPPPSLMVDFLTRIN